MTHFQLQDLVRMQGAQFVSISETVDITERSYIDLNGCIVTSTADPVFRVYGGHWIVQNGKVVCANGVGFEIISSGMGRIQDVFLAGQNRLKPLLVCEGDSQCYDLHVSGSEWQMPQSMLVPGIYVKVNGPYFNNNTFSHMRCQTNGFPQAPFIYLACDHTANWIYGNTVRQVNFEIPNAGAVHLYSCYGTILDSIQIFDCQVFGSITDSIVKIGRLTPSHLRSDMSSIHQYFRLDGTRPSGIFDIDAPYSGNYPNGVRLSMIGGVQGANLAHRFGPTTEPMTQNIKGRVVAG